MTRLLALIAALVLAENLAGRLYRHAYTKGRLREMRG